MVFYFLRHILKIKKIYKTKNKKKYENDRKHL